MAAGRRVLVRTRGATVFATARPALERAAGAPPGAQWCIDGGPVADDAPLGFPPLIDGAELAWSEPAPNPLGQAPNPAEQGLSPGHPVGNPGVPVSNPPAPTVELRVTAGPDAGLRRALPPGAWVLGRGSTADVRLTDPGLSRRHARIDITPDGARIVDLGSVHGTAVDDEPVPAEGTTVPVGAVVAMASTRWRLAPRPAQPARDAVARGDGTVGFGRSPRLRPQDAPTTVTLPAPRPPADPPRFSWLTLALPLLISGVAAALLRSPLYVAFGLLGPAMSVAQFHTDRRRHAERLRADTDRHDAALAQAHRRIGWLLRREESARRLDCPDLATLAEDCAQLGPRLWDREPGDDDWLELSLGLGSVPARTAVRDPDGAVRHPRLGESPVTVALGRCGVLGLAPAEAATCSATEASTAARGDPVAGLARTLMIQAVARHSPAELAVWVVASTAELLADWAWLAGTPHARDGESPYLARCATAGASLARVVAELTAPLDAAPPPPGGAATAPAPARTLVLWIDPEAIRDQPGVARILREGPERGIVSICLAPSARALPAPCRAAALVSGEGASLRARLTGPQGGVDVRPDVAAAALARRVGRSLAPLRDATPGRDQALPAVVRLGDLGTEDPYDASAVARRWRASPAETRFALGRDAAGPAVFDLAADGPHVLVGGTTGAGKSELLRALVVGLAAANRPDRLAFVLIDYKGGSAFDACARLPHTVGLVTDLDGEATARALAGLAAELRGREARLRAVGAADLAEYAERVDAGAHGPAGEPHLARLVIVVDEFRALVEELPDFVAGLVRLAALSRSLGLHLVLATQRPAGIVSADMRANLALRIALRVRDAVDSLDIVETPDAAAISSRRPGRAVVRSGAAPPRLIQTTYLGSTGDAEDQDAGGNPTTVHPGVHIRLADGGQLTTTLDDLPLLAHLPADPAPPPPGPAAGHPNGGHPNAGHPTAVSRPRTDLARVVQTLADAARLVEAPSVPAPWLPPLPPLISVAELPADPAPPSGAGTPALGCGGHPAVLAPSLLVDDPSRQRRWAQPWDPTDGHLAVVGGPRSGRTTAVRTFTATVLDAACPEQLAAYLVDSGGGLESLTTYPHVGAYLRLHEEGALRRLLAGLREDAHRGHAEAAGPRRLLVVDGWEQLRAVLDRLDHGAGTEDFLQAVRGAPRLTLLAAGARELLTGPLAGLLTERLVLPLPDPTDAYLAGLDAATGARPPGRARLVQRGLDAQVPLLRAVADPTVDLDADERADAADRGRRASTRHGRCPGPAWRVASLPALVPADRLAWDRAADALPLGLAGDGSTVTVRLDGGSLLIAGPRGSGRSTALRQVAAALERAGRPRVWVHGRAPGPGPGELTALLRSTPGAVCLVDDVEALLGGELEEVLATYADAAQTGSVVAAGTLSGLIPQYRGLIGALRRGGHGLVLSPGPRGAELFGTPLPDGEPPLPGRGYLVQEHRTVAVQVAVPGTPGAARGHRQEGPGPPDLATAGARRTPAMPPTATRPSATAAGS